MPIALIRWRNYRNCSLGWFRFEVTIKSLVLRINSNENLTNLRRLRLNRKWCVTFSMIFFMVRRCWWLFLFGTLVALITCRHSHSNESTVATVKLYSAVRSISLFWSNSVLVYDKWYSVLIDPFISCHLKRKLSLETMDFRKQKKVERDMSHCIETRYRAILWQFQLFIQNNP